jgi:hypothetical protein
MQLSKRTNPAGVATCGLSEIGTRNPVCPAVAIWTGWKQVETQEWPRESQPFHSVLYLCLQAQTRAFVGVELLDTVQTHRSLLFLR